MSCPRWLVEFIPEKGRCKTTYLAPICLPHRFPETAVAGSQQLPPCGADSSALRTKASSTFISGSTASFRESLRLHNTLALRMSNCASAVVAVFFVQPLAVALRCSGFPTRTKPSVSWRPRQKCQKSRGKCHQMASEPLTIKHLSVAGMWADPHSNQIFRGWLFFKQVLTSINSKRAVGHPEQHWQSFRKYGLVWNYFF